MIIWCSLEGDKPMGVSIISTTYNDSHFLPKALSSCLQQDIEKEIIIIDDCSTKPFDLDAQALVSQHGMRYIRHTKNQGLSAARNTGIAAAKYPWIIPLDADDWFYPNAIKSLYEAKESFEIICGSCSDSGVYVPAIAREPLSPALFKRENPLICSSLFTKEIWNRVGGYVVRPFAHYEDYSFWAKCFKAGAKFKYIPITVYNHTSRENSMLRQLQSRGDYFRKLATEGVFD